MKNRERLSCPSCHSPIPPDRFEHAFAAGSDYRICPECDYTFLLVLSSSESVSPPFTRDTGAEAAPSKACSMSA